jgi:hypothetical protein
MTHDYKGHGTTTLFAALNVLDGKLLNQCRERHAHQDWISFLRLIDRETPTQNDVHVVADNYSAQTSQSPALATFRRKIRFGGERGLVRLTYSGTHAKKPSGH